MGFFSDLLGLNWGEKWAVSSTRKAAEQGDAVAQNVLGGMFTQGTSVPQDYKTAASWYRKAAEQGNAEAQNRLGHIYTQGEGIPQDYKLAAYWFRKAAEHGDVGSLSLLRQAQVAITSKDPQEADAQFVEWLKKRLPKLTPEQKAARKAEVSEMIQALNQKRHEKE